MQQGFGMGEENIPTLKTNFSFERGQPNRLRNYERKQPEVGEDALLKSVSNRPIYSLFSFLDDSVEIRKLKSCLD